MKNNKLSFLNLIITFFSILLIIGVFAYSFNFLREIADKLELELFEETDTEDRNSDDKETEVPETPNNNGSEETIKILLNIFKVDYDEENWEYKESELYKSISLTIKQGAKFKYALEDLSSEGYYPSTDMILEGAFNTNQTFDIYYYKCIEELEPYGNNSTDKSVTYYFGISNLRDKCLILRPNVDYDIEKVIFTVDYLTGSYSFVIDEFVIPKDGYLVLFPSVRRMLGFEKKGDSYNNYMTCISHEFFEEFRNAVGDVYSDIES